MPTKDLKRLAWSVGLGATALFASGAAMAEQTRSFAVGWFIQAAHSYEGDCPDGVNPLPEEMFREEFRGIGMPEEQIEKILGGLKGGNSDAYTKSQIVNRGRIDGKPVNAYTYPMAVPDVGFHEVKGKFAYGFNLDGKLNDTGYEDPETGEKGVDNLHWDNERDKMPAWLITIKGEDLTKDGPVTVQFRKGLEHVSRDANGYVRSDSTFRVDPDPRWQNSLKAELKGGVVNITEPGEIHLSGDPYGLTELDLSQARMRLKLNADGTAEGILGGYIPWIRIFFVYGSSGYNSESMIGTDIPGVYYALRKHADAYPDPKTGQNTAISTSWRLALVPAFAIPAENDAD